MRKARLVVGAVVLAWVMLLVSGCGGSGGGGAARTEGISGSIAGAPDPQALVLALDGQPLQVRPQSDGAFAIPGVPPGEHVLSVVAPDGNAGAHVTLEVDGTGTADAGEIELGVGGQIVGIVARVEGDGGLTPLEGVQVTATVPQVWIMQGGETQPDIWPPPDDRPSDLRILGFTAADGSYRLQAVPPGEYEVRVVVPGLEAGVQWVYVGPASTAVADFHLRKAIEKGIASVEGQVTSAEGGEPIAGAVVSITVSSPYVPVIPENLAVPGRAEGDVPVTAWFDWYTFATLTDGQGRYHLNVPSGYLDVSVFAEGYDPFWQQITLQPDQTRTLDVALSPMQGWPPPTGPTEPPDDVPGGEA
jgi:hypothetical protein